MYQTEMDYKKCNRVSGCLAAVKKQILTNAEHQVSSRDEDFNSILNNNFKHPSTLNNYLCTIYIMKLLENGHNTK